MLRESIQAFNSPHLYCVKKRECFPEVLLELIIKDYFSKIFYIKKITLKHYSAQIFSFDKIRKNSKRYIPFTVHWSKIHILYNFIHCLSFILLFILQVLNDK